MGQQGLRRKMVGAHLPFRQHAIRQGVAVRDSRRCHTGALEGGVGDGAWEGMRGDDTQECNGDAAGGRSDDDGIDRWLTAAQLMVDCGDATITGASIRGSGTQVYSSRGEAWLWGRLNPAQDQ